MARTAAGGQTVALRFQAYDNSSETIKSIGKEVKRMPESFSKASAAMSALGTVSGEVGGTFAAVASKATGLLSIVMSGGPLGVGIAALTVAVGAAKVAWDVFTLSTREAAEAAAAVEAQLSNARKGIDDHRQRVERLEESARRSGKSQVELSRESLRNSRQATKAIDEELSKNKDRVSQIEKEIKLEVKKGVVWGQSSKDSTLKIRSLATERDRLKEKISIDEKILEQAKMSLSLYEREAEANEKLVQVNTKLSASELAVAAAKNIRAKAGVSIAKEERQETEQALDDLDSLVKEGKKSNESLEKSAQSMFEENMKQASDYYNNLADMQEREAKAQESRDAERSKTIGTYATEIAGVLQGQMTAVALGQKSIGEASRDTILQTMQTSIQASAAMAAAKQLDAHSYLPFVGLLLGGAAASAIFAAIMAYLSKGPKAAHGGLVTGGIRGVDSVPVLQQAGEITMPPDVSAAFRRVMKDDRRGTRGTVTQVNNFNSVVPTTSAEATRGIRSVGRALKMQGALV